ncbi:unnamed protein product [Lampetra fluviatilis]
MSYGPVGIAEFSGGRTEGRGESGESAGSTERESARERELPRGHTLRHTCVSTKGSRGSRTPARSPRGTQQQQQQQQLQPKAKPPGWGGERGQRDPSTHTWAPPRPATDPFQGTWKPLLMRGHVLRTPSHDRPPTTLPAHASGPRSAHIRDRIGPLRADGRLRDGRCWVASRAASTLGGGRAA